LRQSLLVVMGPGGSFNCGFGEPFTMYDADTWVAGNSRFFRITVGFPGLRDESYSLTGMATDSKGASTLWVVVGSFYVPPL